MAREFALVFVTTLLSAVQGFAGLQHVADVSNSLSPALHHLGSSSLSIGSADISDLLHLYKRSLISHPLPTKMATGATLAVMGDAIAQSREVEHEYDTRRATSFMVFDSCYRALQHIAFPIIVQQCQGQYLGGLLPHDLIDVSYLGAMEQTLASQLGIVPFLYYPVFFTLTGLVQGLSSTKSWERAKESFLPLMKRNLLFWIPVQFVQFAFIEENMQIPFLSICGLAWTFILSAMAGSAKSYAQEQLNAADDAHEYLDTKMATDSSIDPDILLSEIFYDDIENEYPLPQSEDIEKESVTVEEGELVLR